MARKNDMPIKAIAPIEILQGDCREVLKTLPDNSVNCCVTSPPYFGLRDYGVNGQIGLEQTPNEYVAEMVVVFREVRRVLRDDGTLWLNLGDSYAGSGKGAWNVSDAIKDAAGVKESYRPTVNPIGRTARIAAKTKRAGEDRCYGFKPKDLIGIPWRVAFALQADGWYLRQDIIWHKPNPMPESVTDRCTKSHEYIFLLAKSQKYYFDQEAIKEPATYANCPRGDGHRYNDGQKGLAKKIESNFRNRRSVWTVNIQPYPDSHFATYPPELIRPMIEAGCPIGGTVLDPFGGSGTTGEVAQGLSRNAILIELNPEYIQLIEKRTVMPLLAGSEAGK